MSFCKVSLAEEVVLYSASAQGNGYNWAATLGWASESLRQTALYAKQQEAKTGKPYKVEIASFSGGSSAAAVSVLFDSALQNTSINSNPLERKLSADEALKLADLISFVSRGSDYDLITILGTVFRSMTQQFKVFLYKLLDQIPLIRNFVSDGIPKINNHVINRKVVISDFGRLIFFVRNVNYEKLKTPIFLFSGYDKFYNLSYSNSELKSVLGEVRALSDSPLVSMPDFEKANEVNTQVKNFLDWQKSQIRKLINEVVQENAGRISDHFRRFGRSMKPDIDYRNQFTEELKSPLGNGIMTAAFVKDYKDLNEYKAYVELNKKVPYDDLKVYVFMNRQTAERLLSSDRYRTDLQRANSLLRRYVIAVVDQKWSAINNSIQEPNLFEDLAGKLNSDNLRINSIYDPNLDINKEFNLAEATDEKVRNKYIYVVGGFPYQPILSLLQNYYNRLFEKNKASKFFHFTLEKDQDPRDVDQFSIALLNKQLKPIQQIDPAKNIDDYVNWYEEAKRSEDSFSNSEQHVVVRTKMLWQLHKLPAQLANLGHILFLKGKKSLLNSFDSTLKFKARNSEHHDLIGAKSVRQCSKFYQAN